MSVSMSDPHQPNSRPDMTTTTPTCQTTSTRRCGCQRRPVTPAKADEGTSRGRGSAAYDTSSDDKDAK